MIKYVLIGLLCFGLSVPVNATEVGEILSFPFVCLNRDIIERQIDTVYETGSLDNANKMLKKAVDEKECVIFPTIIEAVVAAIGKTRDNVKFEGHEKMKLEGHFTSVAIKGKNGVLYWTVDFTPKE